MYKLRGITTLILLCLLFIISLSTTGDDEGSKHNVEGQEKKTTVSDIPTSVFSLSATITSYWEKVKTMINQVQAYFFPPNLDFRGGDKLAEGNGSGGGAGEKVKEAVAKSLEKSKETVDDSAKSAAKLAGETVQKTAEKVKKSLSKRDEAEL